MPKMYAGRPLARVEGRRPNCHLVLRCGTLFFCDNNDNITRFEGNRDFWGARAIAIVASLNR
ncbi:MAG: hypothetical protein HWN65_05660 [Candidatus Helarchaeota archaeon]|nr:hypothetical protein [Candidatus Helarchaeota archaeon]